MRIKGLGGDIRDTRDKSKVNDMREQIKQLEQQVPQIEGERNHHTQYYEIERDKKAAQGKLSMLRSTNPCLI